MSEPLKLKNIILVAGTGAVGRAIVNAISALPTPWPFDSITLTHRPSSSRPSWLPSSIKDLPLDTSDPAAVRSALQGQDAVLALYGHAGLPLQHGLLDAAIEAGVKLFLPSTYGFDASVAKSNTKLPALKPLGVFSPKTNFDEYLSQKVAEGKIHTVAVHNSLFLDFALRVPLFGIDIKSHTARIVDDGNKKVDLVATTDQIGQATVQLLISLTKSNADLDKHFHIATITVSQNEVIAEFEKQTPGVEWNKVVGDTSEGLVSGGLESIKAGDRTGVLKLLRGAALNKDEKYVGKFGFGEADRLGVKKVSLEEVVKSVLAEQK